MDATAPPLLDISDLTVEFATRRGTVRAIQQVNISVAKGETLGVVGESGSGKSVTSYAVMRILDRAGQDRQRDHHVLRRSTCARRARTRCATCAGAKSR